MVFFTSLFPYIIFFLRCAINLIQGGASLKSKVVIFSAKEIQRRKALEDKQDQNEEKEDKEEEEEVDEEDEEKEEEEEGNIFHIV